MREICTSGLKRGVGNSHLYSTERPAFAGRILLFFMTSFVKEIRAVWGRERGRAAVSSIRRRLPGSRS